MELQRHLDDLEDFKDRIRAIWDAISFLENGYTTDEMSTGDEADD